MQLAARIVSNASGLIRQPPAHDCGIISATNAASKMKLADHLNSLSKNSYSLSTAFFIDIHSARISQHHVDMIDVDKQEGQSEQRNINLYKISIAESTYRSCLSMYSFAQ